MQETNFAVDFEYSSHYKKMEVSYKDRIASQSDWNALAHAPEDSRFARQSVVKVVVKILNPPHHDDVEVYFLQSKKWFGANASAKNAFSLI